MKIIKIAALVPSEYTPTRDTPYIYQYRLTDTETVSRTTGRRANKEYIVRIYRYQIPLNGDTIFGVIAFYGRIGSTLTMDWKGSRTSRSSASHLALITVSAKQMDTSKHYVAANDITISQWRAPGRNEIDTPVATPSPQSQPQQTTQSPTVENIPSIRLSPEYIPNNNTSYIESTRMVMTEGAREFVIRVYVYMSRMNNVQDDRYVVVEWYTPDGREFRIHPKLITTGRDEALSMARTLVNIKRRQGYQAINDNRAAPGIPYVPTVEPEQTTPVTTQPSSESFPSIDHFINEITGTGMASMGNYDYSISRVARKINNLTEYGYEVVEIDTNNPAYRRERLLLESRNFTRVSAIRTATEWALEKSIASMPQEPPPPQKPQEPLSEMEKEFEDLMASNKNRLLKNAIALNDSSDDWYLNMGEAIGKDLRGYFKFIIRAGEEPVRVYSIWWKGLSEDVRIIKHDMIAEEFEKYKQTIMSTAKTESLRAYKEVMMSLGGA